jgi:hypothetical protein
MNSARKSKCQLPALTLGDIRAKNARSLLVFCRACVTTCILEVEEFPDSVPLKWFDAQVICRRCGGKAEVAPRVPSWLIVKSGRSGSSIAVDPPHVHWTLVVDATRLLAGGW